ncbi:MAG TPA: hypothetical protein VGF16_03760 [Bryobacteraceae bacterium]|jgi:hypothetical protein
MKAETKLEQAIRHVRDGKRIVAAQRVLIAKRKEGGHDTEAAENLLAQFERSLEIFEADLRAIQDALKPN